MSIKLVALIVFIFTFHCSYTQQGENYLKLMNDLVLVDSIEVKECFKNGQLKLYGLIKVYYHNEYYYKMNSGKHVRYYRNGSRTVSVYDSWGTNLSNRYYDSKDNLLTQSITTLVDTNADSLDEFLESSNHITFKTYFEDFAYNYKLCKFYLKKSGHSDNGKKDGVWKYYYPSGELKKERHY